MIQVTIVSADNGYMLHVLEAEATPFGPAMKQLGSRVAVTFSDLVAQLGSVLCAEYVPVPAAFYEPQDPGETLVF